MSTNASGNSSDGASAQASQSATSPFSPHATAFGPSSSINLSTSNRIHGLTSDGQSLSSRASSFASSAHDHAAASGPKGISIASSNQAVGSNLSGSPYTTANATPPSAGLFGFGDRIRNSSDHSRQSSGGAGSNFSATSAAAAAASSANPLNPASSGLRRSQSPLPQHMSGRNSFAPSQTDLFNQSQSAGFNGRSPTSLVPPFTGHEQRRLSSSSGIRNDSPSLLHPDAGAAGARPPFGRQSFSDGPSSSTTNLLSADPTSATMDMRQGSFSSNNFATGDPSGPLPANPLSGNLDPTSGLGAPAPSTGPLSPSDPRTQLLVSNLPYRVRWQDLKDLFRKAGTVLRADVSLSADNRSRGYGTVLMATEQDAIKAADMLGGFTWQGRTLDVRVDRSGTLVGVAGSAVMPTLASNGLSPSPIHIANGPMASNQSVFGGADQSQFLGVPSGFGGSQSHSPGSFTGAASPSALSPLARAVDASQPISTRASFSTLSEATLGGGANQASELERAMFQSSNNGNPNCQRPGSNFDAGFGGGPAQHRAISAVQSLDSNQMGSRRGSEVGGGVGMAGVSPPSGLWGSGANDVASSLYSSNAGGSSVPTGFPGATAMAPWSQGPGALGNPAMASVQSQPFNSQMPTTSYAGRVLFVGNLPFHCQWQDLKDLFRAAGNIQRADVAIGPDGRSRGFGTVLFASQENAQNAVRLYHGYEYSGRTLKVHFDRFAAQNGPAIGTPGNPAQYTGAFAAAALPSHMTNSVRAPSIAAPMQAQPMQGGFGQQPYPQQSMQQQQRAGGAFMPQQQAPASFGQAAFQSQNPASLGYAPQYHPSLQMQAQQQQKQRYGQQQQQQSQQQQMASGFSAFGDAGRALQGTSSQPPFSMFGNALNSSRQNADGSSASDRRDSSAKAFGLFASSESSNDEDESAGLSGRENDYGMSITLPANGFGAASSYLPSDLMSPGLVSPSAPTNNSQHPGRIQLPSSNFAHSFGAAVGAGQGDQMSPMTARMQVPMTPSMPGFTFHQVPQTPPLYPQFLSPGIGPFSPTIGGSSSQTGAGGPSAVANLPQNEGAGANMGGYMSAAPGAPGGYNPMFPTSGAGYGQQQPATPHWSQPSGPRRVGPTRQLTGMYGSSALDRSSSDEVVDDVRSGIAKTPGAGPRRPSHVAVNTDKDAGGAGGHSMTRRASDGTPGAVEPSMDDGYPFPMVAAANVSHLTRRASTNSPAGTPLASGPSGGASRGSASGGKEDSAATSGLSTGEMLAGASAEELANTIARLSVKGTALAKDSGSRRSLSMTAERSAAASAMAKLREKAGTPTPAHEEGDAGTGLGAPFGASASSAESRAGLSGRTNSNKPSPLALSEVNASQLGTSQQQFAPQQQAQQSGGKQEPIEQLLGLRMSNSVLEAARNGSALDTSSDAGGSRKSTPQDEVGPPRSSSIV
ncbi:hypothetical protein NDA16_000356 [Ustilago loliicola]|nr:hypothetical protein NDA16_000356 [Ustilago loliicola]